MEVTLANIDKATAKENELLESFKTFLGENNKWSEFLQKVYRKKVKRKAKDTTEGSWVVYLIAINLYVGKNESEDSSLSESLSSGSSEWNESDDGKASEDDYDFGEGESGTGYYDLDSCPQGCPQADYDQTVAFREMRLAIESEISEHKHLLESIKKEAEMLSKKAKNAQHYFQQAASELQAFQVSDIVQMWRILKNIKTR